jgi:hypothetical protein
MQFTFKREAIAMVLLLLVPFLLRPAATLARAVFSQ